MALERKIYKESFYEFFKVAFCQLHPGKPLDDNWHIKYLCDILQKETFRIVAREPRTKDIIINIPPRSLKSYLVSVIWPVWSWAIDPSLKIATISYADDIALILSRLSKNLINTVWFQRLYGYRVRLKTDVSGAGHYETDKTGIRKAIGIAGGITGLGFDILILDDPQNPKKAASEVERANTIELYKNTIYNRLNDAEIGLRIIIQQRLHMQDLTGNLMDPKDGNPDDYLYICIPAEYDEQVVSPPELKKFYKQSLFAPLTFTPDVLRGYKKMGSLYYAGQYQQRPVPLEGNLFKRKWFPILAAETVARNERVDIIHFVLDTAYTDDKSEKNDPSGILSAFSKDGYLYILNFVQVWHEFPKFLKFLPQYVQLNGYGFGSTVNIEPKASGKSIGQQLKAITSLNVMEIKSDMLKDDKVTRANSISGIAESGRIMLIEGAWNELFLSQICTFPKATHDEAVDCLCYMVDKLLPVNNFVYGFL